MKRTILSMGVVAALAANTYGAGTIWYSATPGSPNATVTGGGNSGEVLALACDKALAPCVWNVTVSYNNTDGGATGWALDLFGPAGFSVTNQTAPAHALNGNNPGNAGAPGGPGELLLNAAGGNTTVGGAGPALWTLQTFTLTKAQGPDVGTSNLFAAIGSAEFGGNDPAGFDSYEVVQIGDNAPRPGFAIGAAEPNPVITVFNVPEPGTLSLLAVGALAMIRRRK